MCCGVCGVLSLAERAPCPPLDTLFVAKLHTRRGHRHMHWWGALRSFPIVVRIPHGRQQDKRSATCVSERWVRKIKAHTHTRDGTPLFGPRPDRVCRSAVWKVARARLNNV